MAATSARSWASIDRRSSSSSASVGTGGGGPRGRAAGSRAIVARARCRALLTATTDMSSSVGGLLRRPVEDVAQDQDRALARRQQLDRGEERQLDRLARDRRPCRARPRAARSRRAGGPGRAGARAPRRATGASATGEPPVGAPDRVEADVRGDPVEPRPEGRRAVEGLAGAPRPQEGLLDGVLGLLERAEHPVRVHVQLAPVAARRGRRRRCRRRSRSSASDRTIGTGRAVHARRTSRRCPDSSMSFRPPPTFHGVTAARSRRQPASKEAVDGLKLEVVVIPVSDVDRAKSFYARQLGFTVDVDQSYRATSSASCR